MEKVVDFLGIFILISGFIIGLGAVTVIDIHGFLGRKSSYWTQATTRTHKVTKPLIWIGVFMLMLGELVTFRNELLSPIFLVLFGLCMVLLLNGLFLSFKVSPFLLKKEKEGKDTKLIPKSWQNKIAVSLLFSDFGWWLSVVLVSYFLSQK